MKLLSGILAFLVVVSCSLDAAATPPRLVREFRKTVRLSVDTVKGNGKILATGVPIDKSSILTAGHFCESAKEGSEAGVLKDKIALEYINDNDEVTKLEGGEIVKFEFSPTQDLCIVLMPKHGIRPVRIAWDYNVKFGDKVYVVGSPHGFFPIITDGYVAQPLTQEMPVDILNNKLMVSSAATNGNSGGAVFNQRGEVIGIAVMVHPQYGHITWAVTALDILRFLLDG